MTKAEATESYEVQITPNFLMPTRNRAGFTFTRGEKQVLELTKDQVEEFENDRYFNIKAADGEEETQGEDAGDGEGDLQPDTTTPETDTKPETTTPGTEGEDDKEETDSAPERDTLMRDNNRAQLDKLALEAGVEKPEELETKGNVADAIIAAKG